MRDVWTAASTTLLGGENLAQMIRLMKVPKDMSGGPGRFLVCSCLKLGSMMGIAAVLFAGDAPQKTTRVILPESRPARPVTAVSISPKNVPEIIVAPARPAAVATAPEAIGIDQTIQQIAADQAVSADLVNSIIKVESNYNARAISSKGALGLMQLVPSTARRFGVSNAFDPRENVAAGVKYLNYLLQRYQGNYPLALAAYNAGEGAVARYGGVPPYRETQNYLVEVWKQLRRSRQAAAPQKGSKPN